VLEEDHIQEVYYVSTVVAGQPDVGVLLGLEGKRGSQRDDPGVVEEG